MLQTAEQRVNLAYMLLMIAFEAAILIYLFVNTWDTTRFFFGGIGGGAMLIGIVINAVFYKKNYPWIKYVNNIVMLFAIFMLCGLTSVLPLMFILLPFVNCFYLRPRFSALTGVISLFMMYIGIMSVLEPIYKSNGELNSDIWSFLSVGFDFSDPNVVTLFEGRGFLLIVAIALVIFSVYLSLNIKKGIVRQGELTEKTLSTQTELDLARDIQEGILSADYPDNDSYAIYAEMKTAAEVGGDFYDYFLIDESHLAIVIGDVSGHGMSAAMFMTLSKTLIKVYAQAHHAVDKVFELTNRYLQQSNPAKFFVTSWLGIVDLTTGNLFYANAGHNYPVLIRNGGAPEFLRTKSNFVLGRKRLVRYQENRIKLMPGDKLILYTDGVTEAQSPDGSFFGDDRLLDVIGSVKEADQKELVRSLRRAVFAFENGGEHLDDATLLTLFFRSYLTVDQPEQKTFFLNKESFDSVTQYIIEKCREAGCDEDTLGDMTLATSEILANIDSYAYEGGGEIEILTKCRDRRMTVVFRDSGPPFDPLHAKEPDVISALNKRKPGGLGIFIIKKLMSDVRYVYENGQNVLTIEKDF